MQFPEGLERVSIDALKPYANNARTHSKRQIKMIERSIKLYGFNNPVMVDDDLMILAGHGRVAAAKILGAKEVPIVRLSHLSEAEKRAYILADNRLAEKAGWDKEILAIELQGLMSRGVEIESVGFEIAEVDIILEAADARDAKRKRSAEDTVPALQEKLVSRLGDVWVLGRHRLVCGDARDPAAYAALIRGRGGP